jgi:hypothetical protein
MAKGYDNIGNCNDTECQYFDRRMELNCSYSLDNSKCWKQEQKNREDTIIPQKLALYEESLKVLLDVGDDLCNICGLPCGDKRCEYYQKIKSIIDRAKKITEE